MSAERLPLLKAALVIARRDFTAIMFSRSFFFFLLGPLFPVAMMVLAGGVGERVENAAAAPQVGIAMRAADVDAMLAAHDRLSARLGPAIPDMVVLDRLEPGESYDARATLERREGSLAAVLTGTPAAPQLTAPPERLQWWSGPIALIAADAQGTPRAFPEIRTEPVATSGASEQRGRMRTAHVGQLMLFL